MIKLYWCPRTRSSRALWLMEESGLAFERVLIDIRSPDGFMSDSDLALPDF